jgi:hypothetical protein
MFSCRAEFVSYYRDLLLSRLIRAGGRRAPARPRTAGGRLRADQGPRAAPGPRHAPEFRRLKRPRHGSAAYAEAIDRGRDIRELVAAGGSRCRSPRTPRSSPDAGVSCAGYRRCCASHPLGLITPIPRGCWRRRSGRSPRLRRDDAVPPRQLRRSGEQGAGQCVLARGRTG